MNADYRLKSYVSQQEKCPRNWDQYEPMNFQSTQLEIALQYKLYISYPKEKYILYQFFEAISLFVISHFIRRSVKTADSKFLKSRFEENYITWKTCSKTRYAILLSTDKMLGAKWFHRPIIWENIIHCNSYL